MKRITATINNNEKPSKNPSTTNLPSSSTSSSLNTNVNGLHYPKISYVPPSKITLNRVSTIVSIPKTNYNQHQQASKPSSLPKPTSTSTASSVSSTSAATTNTEKKSSIVDIKKNIDHHHDRPARVHFNKKIFKEDIRPVSNHQQLQQHQKSLIPRYPTSTSTSTSSIASVSSHHPATAQNKRIKNLLQEDIELTNHANKTPPKIILYKSKFHNLAEHNKNLDLERERKDKEKRLSSKFYDPQEVKSFIEKQRELNRLIKEREEEERKHEQERIKRRVDLLNRKCRTIVKNCNKKGIIIISPTKTKSKPAQAQFQVIKQRPVTSTTISAPLISTEKDKDKVKTVELPTATATQSGQEQAKLFQFQGQSQDKNQELQLKLLKEKKKSPKSCDNENENGQVGPDSSHHVNQFQKIVQNECMKILNNCKIIEPTQLTQELEAAPKKRKPSTNSECLEIEPNRKRLKDFLSPPLPKDKDKDKNKISPKKVDHSVLHTEKESESLQHNIGLEFKKISKSNSTLSPLKHNEVNEVSPKSKSKHIHIHHSDYKITNSNLVNEFKMNVEKECMEILNNCNLNVFEDTSVSKIDRESNSKTNTSRTDKDKILGSTSSLKKSPKKSKSDNKNKFELERADFKKLKEVLLSPPSKYHQHNNHHSSSIPLPLKYTSEMDAIRNLFPAKECENSNSQTNTNMKIKSAKSTNFMSILKEKYENDDNDKNNNNNEPKLIPTPNPKLIRRNELDNNRTQEQEQEIFNHFTTNENIEDSNRKKSSTMTISRVALLKNAMLRNDTSTTNKVPTNIFAELKKCQRESMRATSSCAKLISELKARGYETNEMIPEREQDGNVSVGQVGETSEKNANVSIKSSIQSRSRGSHSSASVSAISSDKEELKEKEDTLSESNFEAVSLSQHSIRDSIDEYSLDFESERICTETTRHSNSTSIFPLSNEMTNDNDKQQQQQQLVDKSINISRIDENFSTNENSRIDSEINEEEFESVSSDVRDKVQSEAEEKEKQSVSNSSSNEVPFNSQYDQKQTSSEKNRFVNSSVPTKLQLFDEESINEELEVSKNESIAEEFEEGNNSQSEHHFSTSNILSVKTTSQEVDDLKGQDDLKEIFSSHDNSRIETETETEVNKSISESDAEILEEKLSQKSVEVGDSQVENSTNFREADLFFKKFLEEENLSSKQKFQKDQDQDQEKVDNQFENSTNFREADSFIEKVLEEENVSSKQKSQNDQDQDQEKVDNQFENSTNFRKADSFIEKVLEGEEGVNKSDQILQENLSSNQKSQNDQDQEKDEPENPSNFFVESIAEELEITKTESIAENEEIKEVDEYSQIFESEHHISTSNIPLTLIESTKDKESISEDNDQELEKSLNNSIPEDEEEKFSTIESEIQEDVDDKSDIVVVGENEKDFLLKEEQQQIIETEKDQTPEKSQDDSNLQKSVVTNDEIEKTEGATEEYTQDFETEQEQATSPNRLLDELLIDENEEFEWFEDELSNAADGDKDVLKKEAVKILSERMKVENEIRALELSANSPTSSQPQPAPAVINESLAIVVPTSINSRTSLSFSDGIIDKPPPPYFSISQATSPESLSNSISLKSFMISCEESKVKELVVQHIDSIWDYWVHNKDLPTDFNEEEDELGDGAEKMNLSNASSNINYYEDKDREKDQDDDDNDLVIQKSPANIANIALQSLLKDLINETTHEVLLVQTEYGKSFMDRIRVGPLALQAQKFRVPKAKSELVSRVLQKVTEFIPELIWEHELVAATCRKNNLTKWSSRSRDIVDQLLAEELVIEDREFNETWPEEVIIMEKLQDKITRMIIQDVHNNFTQAYA